MSGVFPVVVTSPLAVHVDVQERHVPVCVKVTVRGPAKALVRVTADVWGGDAEVRGVDEDEDAWAPSVLVRLSSSDSAEVELKFKQWPSLGPEGLERAIASSSQVESGGGVLHGTAGGRGGAGIFPVVGRLVLGVLDSHIAGSDGQAGGDASVSAVLSEMTVPVTVNLKYNALETSTDCVTFQECSPGFTGARDFSVWNLQGNPVTCELRVTDLLVAEDPESSLQDSLELYDLDLGRPLRGELLVPSLGHTRVRMIFRVAVPGEHEVIRAGRPWGSHSERHYSIDLIPSGQGGAPMASVLVKCIAAGEDRIEGLSLEFLAAANSCSEFVSNSRTVATRAERAHEANVHSPEGYCVPLQPLSQIDFGSVYAGARAVCAVAVQNDTSKALTVVLSESRVSKGTSAKGLVPASSPGTLQFFPLSTDEESVLGWALAVAAAQGSGKDLTQNGGGEGRVAEVLLRSLARVGATDLVTRLCDRKSVDTRTPEALIDQRRFVSDAGEGMAVSLNLQPGARRCVVMCFDMRKPSSSNVTPLPGVRRGGGEPEDGGGSKPGLRSLDSHMRLVQG